MAVKNAKKITGYKIMVIGKPDYIGIGAGGVQFAYGEAKVSANSAIVSWYKEHTGYQVEEITEDATEKDTVKE